MIQKGTVLVTGITGYIGSFVANEFLKEGYKVRGTVRNLKDQEKYRFVEKFLNRENLEIVQLNLEFSNEIENAVKGCDYIAHIASAGSMNPKLKEIQVIKPTVEGCLNVLFAASKFNVKAVVVTGTVGSHIFKNKKKELINGKLINFYDDDDWSERDTKKLGHYVKSKILEERLAWDYYKTLDPSKRFRLTFINPTLVIGPFFHNRPASTSSMIFNIINGNRKSIPDVFLDMVDVRDVAKTHRLAIEVIEADSKRFICSSESLHFKEICKVLKTNFPELPIPTKPASYLKLYILSFYYYYLNFTLNLWGKNMIIKNLEIQKVLKMEFKPIKETLIDFTNLCKNMKIIPAYNLKSS